LNKNYRVIPWSIGDLFLKKKPVYVNSIIQFLFYLKNFIVDDQMIICMINK